VWRGFDKMDPSSVTTPTPILFAELSMPRATSGFRAASCFIASDISFSLVCFDSERMGERPFFCFLFRLSRVGMRL
jgi:hypothetical protein